MAGTEDPVSGAAGVIAFAETHGLPVTISEGQHVTTGDLILVLEPMKME